MTRNIFLNLISDSYQGLFLNLIVIEKVVYGLTKRASFKSSKKIREEFYNNGYLNPNEIVFIDKLNERFNQFSKLMDLKELIKLMDTKKKNGIIHLVIGGEIEQIQEILDQNDESKFIFFNVSKKIFEKNIDL